MVPVVLQQTHFAHNLYFTILQPQLYSTILQPHRHLRPTPPTRRGARAAAAAAPQPGRIPRSAIVAILAAVRRSTPVRVVPVN